MAAGKEEQIEEERRLLYVAMTRARDHLSLIHPLRFFTRQQHRFGDRHIYAPRTRFIPDELLQHFERYTRAAVRTADTAEPGGPARIDIAARLRASWSI